MMTRARSELATWHSWMNVVTCESGKVLGSVANGLHVFKGIPYAEPIEGSARWLPPMPRRPWNGVFNAQTYSPPCAQFGKRALMLPGIRRQYLCAITGADEIPEGDDCLRLNVWTPTLDAGAKLPVMVYIHGGGFVGGAANALYDGSRFAQHGVVSVVIQYRLGPPGFLQGSGLFDGELCADNRAFLDQLCVLRWVQQNIAGFGGDPENVTIFGESAGAFSVYMLAVSPQAKGLFKRGIAMGGMAQTCAPADEYHSLARDALSDIGVKRGDAQALIGLDKQALIKLHASISKRIFQQPDPDRYGSLSRGRIAFQGAAQDTDFLPRSPLDSYANGQGLDVELMVGTCANDGGLFSLLLPLGRSLSADMFSRNLTALTPGGDMAAMRAHYEKELPHASRFERLQRINNDAFYRMPTYRLAEARANAGAASTFLYQLDYPSVIHGLGAIHGIDCALLFNTSPMKQLLDDDAQTHQLADAMIEAWTGFARSGVPFARDLPEWPAFDLQNRVTMVLDRASRALPDLDVNFVRRWA